MKHLFLSLILFCSLNGVAYTANISSKTSLAYPTADLTTITFNYDFEMPIDQALEQINVFNLLYNGEDATQTILDVSDVQQSGENSLSLSFASNLAPGQHTFSTTLMLSGEQDVTERITATVPGDEQNRRVATLLSHISTFLHQYDSYRFAEFISLGTYSFFSYRAYEDDFQLYVDVDYCNNEDAEALYAQNYQHRLFPDWSLRPLVWYYHDMVLLAEPEEFTLGGSNNIQTLWHEMIHAINFGSNGIAKLSQDDHLYIEWAESALRALEKLKYFESFVFDVGQTVTDSNAAQARAYWTSFIQEINSTTYKRLPSDTEKAELKTWLGFDVSADTIMAGYLQAGVPKEYFSNISISLDDISVSFDGGVVSPNISGGTPPYSVQWFMNNDATSTSFHSGLTLDVPAHSVPSGSYSLLVYVSDSAGNTAQDTGVITITTPTVSAGIWEGDLNLEVQVFGFMDNEASFENVGGVGSGIIQLTPESATIPVELAYRAYSSPPFSRLQIGIGITGGGEPPYTYTWTGVNLGDALVGGDGFTSRASIYGQEKNKGTIGRVDIEVTNAEGKKGQAYILIKFKE